MLSGLRCCIAANGKSECSRPCNEFGRATHLLPVGLDEVPDHGSLGVPENEAWPRTLVQAEQIQLCAQLAMVPAGRS